MSDNIKAVLSHLRHWRGQLGRTMVLPGGVLRRSIAVSSRSIAIFALLMIGFSVASGPVRGASRAPVAPQWDIAEWINSDGVKLADLKGRVVVIDFFQMWCPGCNKFSLPLMAHWEKVFARQIEQKKLIIVSIHTVFEGHKVQTVKRLKKYIKRKGITHPVGVDRHEGKNRLPQTMISYNTGGTPEVALIGKHGRIRFQKFGYFEPDGIERFIRILLDE